MPISMPAVSVTGQRHAIVLAEGGDRRRLIVGGLEGDEAPIHQLGDAAVGSVSRNSRIGCRR
jgi:hypothetical protein